MIINENDRITAWVTPTKLCSIQVKGLVIKKMMGWRKNDLDYHPTMLLVKLDEPLNGEDEIMMYDRCVIAVEGR